jgi:hypothetical protein
MEGLEMTAFRTALDNLAALSVPGITNLGIATVPDTLTRAHLPVLLVVPGEASEDRLFKERGHGFETIAFSSGPRTLTVTVTHLLLTAPVVSGHGASSHIPALINHMDAYFEALSGSVTLGGVLAEPTRVTVETGQFRYGDTPYHGCAFRHTWTLEITP